MNNQQRILVMQPFKNAIRGWAFCNVDMLSSRLKQGKEEVKKLPNELKDEAYQTLSIMANELEIRIKYENSTKRQKQ
jgi:hypothetical protein